MNSEKRKDKKQKCTKCTLKKGVDKVDALKRDHTNLTP